MKPLTQKIKSLLWVVLVGLLAGMPFQSKAQQADVSFQVFYDELAPYGEWLQHPRYGDVWSPNVEGEFTPYLTNGYWTVSQYGNTWVSNYDWGWATFHYGRWFFDDMYGWVWIPDNTWAPAWVVWRNGGGYYGWAPMSPGLNFSVSLNIYSGIPSFYWSFVPQQYVWRPYVYRYCAPRQRNVYIVNNTTYVTHYHGNTYNYFSGPSHTEIHYITRRPVVINQIENCDRPGRAQFDRDKIVMYRPVITRNDNDRPKLTSVPRDNNGLHKGWDNGNGPFSGGNNNGNSTGNDGNGDNGTNGNNGNGGNGQGNNGHGNGDQDAPGNSGGNNNGENSDNSGNGNSGKGNGNSNNGGRNSGFSDINGSSVYKKSTYRSESQRTENRTTPVRSYSPGNSNNSTNTGSNMNSGRGQSLGNGQMTSGSSGGSTRSYTPSRNTSSSNRSQSGYSPSNSTPTRSQSVSPSGGGSRGNSNVSPSRSGGGQRSTPSNSGGSNSGGSKTSGGGSKKRN